MSGATETRLTNIRIFSKRDYTTYNHEINIAGTDRMAFPPETKC
jgi:hypothetical protein